MLDSNDQTRINHGKIAAVCVIVMLGIILLAYATQPQAEEKKHCTVSSESLVDINGEE